MMWPFIIHKSEDCEFQRMMRGAEKLKRWANTQERKQKHQKHFGESSEGKTVNIGDIGFVCGMGFGEVESIDQMWDIFVDVRLYYNNAIFTVPLSENFRINVDEKDIDHREYN